MENQTQERLRNEGFIEGRKYERNLRIFRMKLDDLNNYWQLLESNKGICNFFHNLFTGINKKRLRYVSSFLDHYLQGADNLYQEGVDLEEKYGIDDENSKINENLFFNEAMRSHENLCYKFASQLPWGMKPEEALYPERYVK